MYANVEKVTLDLTGFEVSQLANHVGRSLLASAEDHWVNHGMDAFNRHEKDDVHMMRQLFEACGQSHQFDYHMEKITSAIKKEPKKLI
jgi:hypothetical protein